MQPRVTAVLKTLIAVMLLLLLAAQVWMIPGLAAATADRFPEFANLEIPGIIAAVVFLICVEVVLICIWRLLSLVRTERIFSSKAFIYVDVIIATMIAASLIIIISNVVILLAEAGSPSILLVSVLGVVVGIALALLVVVLRGLLRKALELEQDMSEVV
ncbi:DUF2975 domain-containing protein [Microbacterium sp.]|uniref:DUF2975 domain-containing protein n=1 Tax=Microbacterium sp. TaxID=51671 RepID=UPI002733A23E|nr:DUF2975 domain-containing protein [Microbacterium sp.]MDP3950553.1 DUF2975 domain-containing protein [Microbacterium sp.]